MAIGEWIEHDGGPMPVDGSVMVLCRFNDGTDEELEGDIPSRADYWDGPTPLCGNWQCGDGDGIAAYKVIAND